MSAATFGDPRLPARFWARLTVTPAGCWEWTGSRHTHGYGRLWVAGRMQYAHRVAYAALVGDLPDWTPGGLTLDHLCRRRACVNPAHLELVSNRENLVRGDNFVAQQSSRTHCLRGHELAGGNLRPDALARGQRQCRTCARGRSAALSAVARAVGITRDAYGARFGWSRTVAEDIAARIESGVRPEVILAGADAAIAATEADLEQLDMFGEAS